MNETKRPRSPSPSSSRKFFKTSEEEEALESILEKIRQQEESETLAMKLQQEFDASSALEWSRSDDNGAIDLTEELDEPSSANPTLYDAVKARAWGVVDTAKNIGTKLVPNSQSMKDNLCTADPKNDLLAFRDMFIRSNKCTKCGESVKSPRNLVVFSTTVPPPSLLALLHCRCEGCGQSHCRGCFRPLVCKKSCKGKSCTVADCCAEVRAIALFEALGGLDRQYLGERMSISESKMPLDRPKLATVGPGGTGYAQHSHQWIKSHREWNITHKRADHKAAEASKSWDDVVFRALETITWLLPAPYSDAAASYDFLPHPSIRSLITLSYLPELLRDLLINDSVTDWTERNHVYNALLKLLRRMTDSELSLGALINERLEKRTSAGIEDWMWGDGTIEWETNQKTNDIVRVPPLFDHFKKLTKQCETFLASASHMLEDGGDSKIEDMVIKATSLCGDMISAHQDMRRALSVMMHDTALAQDISTGKGKERDGNVDLEKRYCRACEKLAFKYVNISGDSVSDGLSYPAYYYKQAVRQSENWTRQPSKRLHLVRELSVISTSLPPGVWVRVDEARNDVIKIMIAGPEGTPYAGGLFEFDCFLPLEYPNVPPKMNLCTTASGKVRFNPNLYSDGKVCLSLLGTWSGGPEEQWSSKSTFLQVIVSIQSMILVEAPFFNEPGFGQVNVHDARSISYNKNIALQAVRWAMVDWMQEQHKSGIWADVIANHFSIRRERISKCIRAWARDDPRFRNYNPSSTSSAGMQTPLAPNHHYSNVGNSNTRDLITEFERGCELIQTWLRDE